MLLPSWSGAANQSICAPCLKCTRGGRQRESRALALPYRVAAKLSLIRLQAFAELVQRLALDLPDALAGQAETFADALQRVRSLGVQAEAHAQDGGLPLVHLVEQVEQTL